MKNIIKKITRTGKSHMSYRKKKEVLIDEATKCLKIYNGLLIGTAVAAGALVAVNTTNIVVAKANAEREAAKTYYDSLEREAGTSTADSTEETAN